MVHDKMIKETTNACLDESTQDFMKDLFALFDKHGKAIVPTYEQTVSFHDAMRVIPLNDDTKTFLTRTQVDPNTFQ